MQPIARQLQQLDYNNENRGIFMWSVPRIYLEDNWGGYWLTDRQSQYDFDFDPISCQLKVSLRRED
jgi:hypothetical protein